jgi:hypothetical protein
VFPVRYCVSETSLRARHTLCKKSLCVFNKVPGIVILVPIMCRRYHVVRRALYSGW